MIEKQIYELSLMLWRHVFGNTAGGPPGPMGPSSGDSWTDAQGYLGGARNMLEQVLTAL